MASFKQLIIENIPRLRRYARALVADLHRADDLVQDCLERAWRKQALWNSKLPIRPWLFTIMHNIFANSARRYNSTPQLVSLDEAHEQASDCDEQQLKMRDLEKALNKLDPAYREIILLVGLEQLSYQEAAEVLGIPMGTVMSRLSRARTQLAEHMNQKQRIIRRVK